MQKVKVTISTLGPLHLIKSAEYLSQIVDVTVVQGWIPTWWNSWGLKLASKIAKYDLEHTFKKRTPSCLNGKNHGCFLPEFLNVVARKLNGERAITLNVNSHELFGKFSKKYTIKGDILHVRSGSGRGGAIIYAQNKGIKVLVDHSIAHPAYMEKHLRNEFEKNNTPFNLGISNPLWKEIMYDCEEGDRLLVNSDFVKNTFIEYGFDANKIDVVYLGVRSDFFGLKKSYELTGPLKILFTGGFGFRKGAEYSLRAMQKLDELKVDYEYIVVGSNAEAQTLLKQYPIKHLKLIGMVPQDNLKQYLSEADIYLFPSLCEGCASSGMEAMAAGLPVIATVESGLPITNEKNGFVIESKRVDDIVDAILKLRNNQIMRTQLGIAASKLIQNNYTWEKYAANVADIYNKMI